MTRPRETNERDTFGFGPKPPRMDDHRLGSFRLGDRIPAFDAVIKLPPIQPVIDTMRGLGWAPEKALLLGTLTLVCTILYAWPKTAVLGAVLLTGYLGGAIATHVRIDSPLASHTLFGVYVDLFVWGGLWLRSPGLRALLPLAVKR